MTDLHRIADELGVVVRRGDLPAGWWGAYEQRSHTITLHRQASGIQYVSALAHELGHAFYRHRGSSARNEREASVWAARTLISARAFRESLHHSYRVQGVAHVLGVMPSDVETYLAALSAAERMVIRQLALQESA